MPQLQPTHWRHHSTEISLPKTFVTWLITRKWQTDGQTSHAFVIALSHTTLVVLCWCITTTTGKILLAHLLKSSQAQTGTLWQAHAPRMSSLQLRQPSSPAGKGWFRLLSSLSAMQSTDQQSPGSRQRWWHLPQTWTPTSSFRGQSGFLYLPRRHHSLHDADTPWAETAEYYHITYRHGIPALTKDTYNKVGSGIAAGHKLWIIQAPNENVSVCDLCN